jgi:hypothetical protein
LDADVDDLASLGVLVPVGMTALYCEMSAIQLNYAQVKIQIVNAYQLIGFLNHNN